MRTCLNKCGPCLNKCGPCLKKCGLWHGSAFWYRVLPDTEASGVSVSRTSDVLKKEASDVFDGETAKLMSRFFRTRIHRYLKKIEKVNY